MTFDEFSSLTNSQRMDIVAWSDLSIKVHVEIEVDIVIQFNSGDEMHEVASEQQQIYSIKKTERGQSRPPKRYTNMVACALLVTGSLDLQGPNSYKEVVSGFEADQWIGAIGDGLESLLDGLFGYLLLCVKDISRIDLLNKWLSDEFEMKDLGAAQR